MAMLTDHSAIKWVWLPVEVCLKEKMTGKGERGLTRGVFSVVPMVTGTRKTS